MKKFYVLHSKGETSILEVECREISLLEEPIQSEKSYRILGPKEMLLKGEYPIIMSWALFDSQDEAYSMACKDIQLDEERTARKEHKEVNQSKIDDRISSIKGVN